MLTMFPGGEHGLSVARFTGPANLSFGLEGGHADLDPDDGRTGRSVCGFLLGFVFACKFFFDLLKPRPKFSVEVADGPEQRALQLETVGEMDRLLEVLPEKQREILVLRVVIGLSAEETAEAVGSTPGAVRVAQHRALARLRKAMTEGR